MNAGPAWSIGLGAGRNRDSQRLPSGADGVVGFFTSREWSEGSSMGKILIFVGLALAVLGVIWLIGERFGLGRLPGDIVIEREGMRIYIPLMTSLIVSIGLSLLLWLFNR
jgi:Protein of unknown function (DUF2905)